MRLRSRLRSAFHHTVGGHSRRDHIPRRQSNSHGENKEAIENFNHKQPLLDEIRANPSHSTIQHQHQHHHRRHNDKDPISCCQANGKNPNPKNAQNPTEI
uniref:Uncharacterized protein n=1 Tax=Opuntia streptacantha TaxID=393608 RepID=A0A7C9B0U7_OPUST